MIEKFISEKEVAAKTGLSRVTLWRKRKEGKLEFHQLTDYNIAYSQSQIEHLLPKREAT